ncbi:MAG: tyrosine-type recombinase/integrase [Anaerobutyricum hallii]|uniref:tyrosine-type recombinase/integrase n=1 Tax=Anaerobutyricum hallii TaxID=39488 RepID=UPI0024308A69|nr:tyrosine-type recombinase/integrase [Anaerobutyricum hallii]MDD6587974.1 tyrosine-type recombinase/integrase [Anaerobutyricum hallii]
MAAKRKDHKGRVLKDGENYRDYDGRYSYRFTDENGKRHTVYAKSLDELRKKEDEIHYDRMDGIRLDHRGITVNELYDQYIDSRTDLKDATRNNYNYVYNHFVRDGFGKRKIADVNFSTVMKFYRHIIDDLVVKPNSLESVHTILHPVFQRAVRDQYIRNNPTDGAMGEIKKSRNWEKPKRRALTIEEQNAFVDFLKESKTYEHWKNMFTLFLGTGCRVSELVGLRWEDCDFENNIISINHGLTYRQDADGKCRFHISTPKTDAGIREIPMLKDVRSALLAEREKQLAEGPCKSEIDGYKNFVFKNRDGGVVNPESINRAIGRIVKEINEAEAKKAETEQIIIHHFSVHNLRHTFCTRFCENETNLKVIQDIMGHSDIQTTMNVYAEATREKKQSSIENLEGKVKIS